MSIPVMHKAGSGLAVYALPGTASAPSAVAAFESVAPSKDGSQQATSKMQWQLTRDL